MKKWEVVRPPIYIEAYEVVSLGEFNEEYQLRLAGLDNGWDVRVYESTGRETQLGDLVRYDVRYDQFHLFDEREIPKGTKLLEMSH